MNWLLLVVMMVYGACLESAFKRSPIDLTIVGQVRFACSIPRIGIGLIDCLKDDLTINHIQSGGRPDLTDINSSIKKLLRKEDKSPGTVALLYDFLSYEGGTPADFVPQESYLKIAYSMIESSVIPERWVEILNTKFDVVVVPDEWLHNVYARCGVTIPIFVIPHGIYLESLLAEPIKTKTFQPFTFGISAGFWERKNHALLIDAFCAEFGRSSAVKLKLHGRSGHLEYEIFEKVRNLKAKNIEISSGFCSEEQYAQFVKSLDCVVLLSKGEGFSIAPREALALGIPCIISDNSAHKTLSKTGFFCVVPSLIPEPAYYKMHGEILGNDSNCSLEDARKALRDVYENYKQYLKKAEQGRVWVQQYLWKNLRKKFLNLVKPKKVLLGTCNQVTDEFFMTSSVKLYEKYLCLT